MSEDFFIRSIEESDVEDFYEHMRLCIEENGVEQPIFTPRESLEDWASFRQKTLSFLETEERKRSRNEFLVFESSTQSIAGHISLSYSGQASHSHRRTIGIVVLKKYQAQGLGKMLMEYCFGWCKANKVEYVDLGVFESNPRAYALYKKLGFQETGRIEDLFRVKGQRLNDIQMSLKL